jgi:hypothetical protein
MTSDPGAKHMRSHEQDAGPIRVSRINQSLRQHRHRGMLKRHRGVERQKCGQVEIMFPIRQRLDDQTRTIKGGERHGVVVGSGNLLDDFAGGQVDGGQVEE